MTKLRDSLSKKLTLMNLMVSAGALLLASAAFFTYDLITFRVNLVRNTSIQAQMIGSNAVSPLIFNDARSAESTLSALRASPRIVYAGIYTADGKFFAGYWRQEPTAPPPLPAFANDKATDQVKGQIERSWFSKNRFSLVRTTFFQGRPAGTVYIQSDLGAMYDRLRSYAIILISIVTASLIAALAISRLLQRVISRPILNLAEMALLVSRDQDYSVRVPAAPGHDEVALLVEAFNAMLFEIQKRESALQEREQQFRTLADSIPQLAWMAEPSGARTWYNHRWYEYTGASPEQMAGWGWQSVHDPARLAEVMQKWRVALATGQPFEMIFPLRGADGTFREFLTLAMPVRDARGQIARWFGTNTDITEQRRSEDALRQTEKLAATGRLAASIAHEINNPLEAVMNLVYLARKQPQNVQKYLTIADQELDRIAQITKNTLGFYRDSTSPLEVDISRVLEEVLALYGRKLQFKKITVQADLGDSIKVMGYGGEIRQIFANLTSNAIDALSENGVLRIRASKVNAGGRFKYAGAHVTFLDNGSGIAPEHRTKIFEPFYTTKKDVGTGLGLWLTRGLVAKHRGVLRMRSSARSGWTWTAFSVFLPRE